MLILSNSVGLTGSSLFLRVCLGHNHCPAPLHKGITQRNFHHRHLPMGETPGTTGSHMLPAFLAQYPPALSLPARRPTQPGPRPPGICFPSGQTFSPRIQRAPVPRFLAHTGWRQHPFSTKAQTSMIVSFLSPSLVHGGAWLCANTTIYRNGCQSACQALRWGSRGAAGPDTPQQGCNPNSKCHIRCTGKKTGCLVEWQ